MNRVIKHIATLAGVLLLLLCIQPEAKAQQYQPRTLQPDAVDGITNQERWRYGRKPDFGNVRRRGRGIAGRGGGLPGMSGGGGGGGRIGSGGSSGGGGDRVTYYDDSYDGSGGYHYSDGNNGAGGGGAYADYSDDPTLNNDPPPVVDPPSTYDPPSITPPRIPDLPNPPTPNLPDVDGEGMSNFLIWLLIALGVGLIIFMIYKNRGQDALKGKKKKAKEESDFVDFEEEEPEDIHVIEFVSEITLAERAGNYRKAVRLRFLNVLKDLSTQNLIQWKKNKTNYDYYYELTTKPELRPGFMDVTTVYEYVWYGEFKIGEEEYKAVDKTFNQFNEQLAGA